MPRARYFPTSTPSPYEVDPQQQALGQALMRPLPASRGGGGGEMPKITHPLQGLAHVLGQAADVVGERRAAEQEAQGRSVATEMLIRALGDPTVAASSASGGGGAGGTFAPTAQGYAPQGGVPARTASFNAKAIPSFVSAAGEKHGISPDFMQKTAWIESKGNPKAVSSTGATGLYQFTKGTAERFGLADRNDPVASADAAARLASANREMLSGRLGRTPTDAELYLAHQQGGAGASALLANPGANVVDALAGAYGGNRAKAAQAVTVNGGRTDMTAGDFSGIWTRKFDGLSRRAEAPQADMPAQGATPVEMPTGRDGYAIPGQQPDAASPSPLLGNSLERSATVAEAVRRAAATVNARDAGSDSASLIEPAGLGFEAPSQPMTAGAPAVLPDLSGTSWLDGGAPATNAATSPLIGNSVESAGDAFAARLASPAIATMPGELPLSASARPQDQAAPSVAPPVAMDDFGAQPPAATPPATALSPNALAFAPSNLPLPASDPTQGLAAALAGPSAQVVTPQQRALARALTNAPIPPERPVEFRTADIPAEGARETRLPPQQAGLAWALAADPNSRDAGAGEFARGNPLQPLQDGLDRIFGGPDTRARLAQGQPVQGGPAQVAQAGGSAPQAGPQAPGFFDRLSNAITGGGQAQGPSAAQLSQMPQADAMRFVMNSPYIDAGVKRALVDKALAKGVVVNGSVVDPYSGRVYFQAPKGLTSAAPGTTLFDQDTRQPVFTAPTKPETTPEQRNFRAAQEDPEFGRFLAAAKDKGYSRVEIDNPDGTKRTMFLHPLGHLVTPEQLGAPAYTPAPAANPFAPGGVGGKPLTEGQSKDVGFANRMVAAHNILTPIDEVGTDRWQSLASQVPGVSNSIVSGMRGSYNQAKENFITAILRKESGAVIGPSEFEREERKYFPQPGDDAMRRRQKQEARELAIEGVMAGAGPSYRPPAEYRPLPRGAGSQQGQGSADAGQQAAPGGAQQQAQPQGRGDGSSAYSPMAVQSPEDLATLKPGTFYRRPDGAVMRKR